MRDGKNAFTLIELLTVLGVILVLMGLLVPSMGIAKNKAKIAATKSMIQKLELAVRQYEASFEAYPPDMTYKYLGKKLYSPTFGAVMPLLQYEEEQTTKVDLEDRTYVDPWGNPYLLYWVGDKVNEATKEEFKLLLHDELPPHQKAFLGKIKSTVSQIKLDDVLVNGFLIWSKGRNGRSGIKVSGENWDDIGNWGHSQGKML